MQFSVHGGGGGGGVGGVAGCCAWEIPEKVMPNPANAIHSFRIIAASELPEQAITGAPLVGETKAAGGQPVLLW
jgi:hypothetical protein